MKFAMVVLLFAGIGFAQTAKVVTLKPEEAAQAKQLHEAAVAAQKAADDFDASIAKKYTQGDLQDRTGTFYTIKAGWEYGMEFSDDFRFIVPKPYQKTAPPCGLGFGNYLVAN